MKRMKRLAALALTLCLLCGCGGSEQTQSEEAPEVVAGVSGGKPLTVRAAADDLFSLNFDPAAGTNPIRTDSAVNTQFWSLLYDSVFTLEEDFTTVTSRVVTDWTTDDYIWWVFRIDTGLRFSDGSPLTAGDIAYSINQAKQSAYYSGRLRCMYGCSALDEGSFAISTPQADSLLPAMLNIPIIKRGDAGETDPVGSGPYRLREDRAALVPNPEYSGGKVPLDIIRLRDYMDPGARISAFEDGEIDLVTNDPTGMYNLGYGSSETRYYDTTNLHFIGFNTRGNYFQSPQARRAVSYLIDREYMTEELMQGCGVPATLPVHPKCPLYDGEYASRFRYDPETAAALLREAGVEDLDDDGKPEILVTGIVVELNIRFIVNSDSSVKLAEARRLTEELNALGITTTLQELSWNDYTEALRKGEFDMYYGELRLGADWNLTSLFRVPDLNARNVSWGMNYGRVADRTLQELYAAFLAAPEEARYDACQAAVQAVCEGGYLIPICFERRQVLTRRGVVSGLRPTQYDIFSGFLDWTFHL